MLARPRLPLFYVALAFCAYTGARRTEMFRCQLHELEQSVQLREKKHSQRNAFTFRQAPLHPQLQKILDDCIAEHPGISHLFCKDNGKPLEDKTAGEAFDAVTTKANGRSFAAIISCAIPLPVTSPGTASTNL